MNTWTIEGGDGYLNDNENPTGGGVVSNNAGVSNRTANNIAGSAISTAAGMALSRTDAANVPGLVGMASGAAGDIARGKNSGQVARNAGMRGLKTGARYGMNAIGVPGYIAGPGVSIGMANVMESQKANPNYGKATVSSGIPSVFGTIAGMAAGPLVGLVAGVVADAFTSDSLENGILGDWTDSRSYETARDNMEDYGWSRDYTDDYTDVFGGGRYSSPVDGAMSGMSPSDQAVSDAFNGTNTSAYDTAMNNFGTPEYDPYDSKNYGNVWGGGGGDGSGFSDDSVGESFSGGGESGLGNNEGYA